MRRAVLLHVSHHLLLKRRLQIRLQSPVPVRKTAVIRRAGDRRQGFITLACLDMAAFDLPIKVLPAVLQRVVDALCADVFDAHGQFAFAGGNKRDSAAHEPTAQHANGAQRSRLCLAARIFSPQYWRRRCCAAPATAASSPVRQRLWPQRHSRCCCPATTRFPSLPECALPPGSCLWFCSVFAYHVEQERAPQWSCQHTLAYRRGRFV